MNWDLNLILFPSEHSKKTLKLKPGEDYNLLKKTFIIFICKFDLFGQGRYVYRFESRCEDDYNLKLEDDAIKVFINTKGIVGEISESFKELIHFMDSSEIKEYKSDLVNDLKNALIEARANEEWRGAAHPGDVRLAPTGTERRRIYERDRT